MPLLAIAAILTATSPLWSQTRSPREGALRVWFRLPKGANLRDLRISAPGFLTERNNQLRALEQPSGFPDWHRIEMSGKVPWSGKLWLRLTLPHGLRYETHPVWSCDVSNLEGTRDLGLVDLRSAFTVRRFKVVDAAGRPIEDAVLYEVGRLPQTENFHSSWGWRGSTDADGIADVVWFDPSNPVEIHARDYVPVRLRPPFAETIVLRRGFPLRVHVPPSSVPKYPFCIEATADFRPFPVTMQDGVEIYPYFSAVFDDSGTATIFVPVANTYSVALSVEIERSFFLNPGSKSGDGLGLPHQEIAVASEAGADLFFTPDVKEIQTLSAQLRRTSAYLWERTTLPTSRPVRSVAGHRPESR